MYVSAWKFKPGAFRLQNYWISQPEPMFLGPEVSNLRYSDLVQVIQISHFYHQKFTMLNAFTKFYKTEKKQREIVLNTLS